MNYCLGIWKALHKIQIRLLINLPQTDILSVLTHDSFISLKNVLLDIKPGKYFLEGAYSPNCLHVQNMDQKIMKVAKDKKKIESH